MCLLSSIDEIDVRVKFLADDVWEAADDKTGFLVVGVDSFDRIFLYKRPIYLPVVQNSTYNWKDDKWE